MAENKTKLLKKEREQITDKEYFTSKKFSKLLVSVFRFMTHSKKEAKVKVIGEADNELTACTDGVTVYLNYRSSIQKVFPTLKLKILSVLGMFYHEVGHMLYTDFAAINAFSSKFEADGVFDCTCNNKKVQREVEDFLKKRPSFRRYLEQTWFHIYNIVEDIWMESNLCEEFPGSVKNAIVLNRVSLGEDVPTLKTMLEDKYMDSAIVLNLFLSYASSGTISNVHQLSTVHTDVLDKAKPYINRGISADNAWERLYISADIFLLMWDLLQKEIEEREEQMKDALQNQQNSPQNKENGTDSQENGSQGNSGANGKNAPNGANSGLEPSELDKALAEELLSEQDKQSSSSSNSNDNAEKSEHYRGDSQKEDSSKSQRISSKEEKSANTDDDSGLQKETPEEETSGNAQDTNAGPSGEDSKQSEESSDKQDESGTSVSGESGAEGEDENADETDGASEAEKSLQDSENSLKEDSDEESTSQEEKSANGREETSGNDENETSDSDLSANDSEQNTESSDETDKSGEDASNEESKNSDGTEYESGDEKNTQDSGSSSSSDNGGDSKSDENSQEDDSESLNDETDGMDEGSVSPGVQDFQDDLKEMANSCHFPREEGEAAEDSQGKGEITYENAVIGTNDGIGEQIRNSLNELATEKTEAKLMEQNAWDIENEANETRYNDIHRRCDVVVNRHVNVNNSDIEEYNNMHEVLKVSKALQKALEKVLKEKKEGVMRKQWIGRGLDKNGLYDRQGRIFAKKQIPNETNLAVSLLIDASGSMSGRKIVESIRMAVILEDFCRAMEIPLHIATHRYGSSRVYYDVFKDFDEIDGKDKYRLMQIRPAGCNRDGMALQFCGEHLLKRPEEKKLLILISDGRPNADSYCGDAAKRDLQKIKQYLKNRKVELFAAAIDSDKDIIKGIYKENFLNITDLQKMPKTMVRLIESFMELN